MRRPGSFGSFRSKGMKKNSSKCFKRIAAFFLCLVLTAALAVTVTASAREAEKTVRVGWYESPFNTTDQFGRRSGYAYEYQEKIAAYAGWKYEYVEGSWPDLMQMLMNGEIDLLSDISYTEERSELILYPSLSMGTEDYYIFINTENPDYKAGDYSYFNGKKVGVNKGSVQVGFFRDWAKANHVEAKLIEVTCSEAESVQMLREGELDAFISIDVYSGVLDALPVVKIGSSDYYFGISKNRPDLLEELNAALGRIQDENIFYNQQLYEKYIRTVGANIFLNEDEIAWLSAHGAIRVGYQDNYLAFCAADQNGALTGALKDYLKDASVCFANAQLDFEPVAYASAAAAFEALQRGEVDCVFPSSLSTSESEALDLAMTPSMMSTEIYALVRKADQHTFFEKEQITVAVEAENPNILVILKDHFPDWQWKECPDLLSCMKAVSSGEADCVVIGNYRYDNLRRQCDRLNLVTLTTGKSADFYIAVNQGSTQLYSILTRTTNIVSKTNINAALSHYSSQDAKSSLIDTIRDNPIAVVVIILVIVSLVIVILAQRRVLKAKKEIEKSRHEVEALNKQVTVDALTHVRNKAGYEGWSKMIDEAISQGEQGPFAVVVCDVNDLKKVNDLYGHKEGDLCIQNCSSKICNIFSHSPVFRVGGDEFVVFLSGQDYYRRGDLMNQINAIPKDRTKIRVGETIAAGIAEFDKAQHHSLLSVFEEADKAMYARKQYLKETVFKKEAAPEEQPTSPDFIPVIHERKRLLIVDDVEMNREIMGDLLEDDYNISYASNGLEALDTLRKLKRDIDLVLLDLQMPNMNGREVLAQMQVDEDLMHIPVVILTVDQNAELDCLRIGAMDFIPKPYPDIDIVKARISKCIELAEDRELIYFTERDKLSGLLNKAYFLRYVSRLDHVYGANPLDAVACDINNFHSVNKLYGRQFGDRVLRNIGTALKKLARETGGISCREEDDTFLLYCPHQENYEHLINGFLSDAFSGKEFADKIRMRFGVFTDAKQAENIEERFERAKIAAARVKNDPEKNCGYYDHS